MVKLTKLKEAEKRRLRELDKRIEYERLRDGFRLEHKMTFQK